MQQSPNRLTGIAVTGFKAIGATQHIEFRPLTILAGANSSGKSSIMQPLLLLKQTLEAPSDPGPLLLDGPNVRFTSGEQILHHSTGIKSNPSFSIRLQNGENKFLDLEYEWTKSKGFDIKELKYPSGNQTIVIRQNMTHDEIQAILPDNFKMFIQEVGARKTQPIESRIIRNRCFLDFDFFQENMRHLDALSLNSLARMIPQNPFPPRFNDFLSSLAHLPGLRGNPRRTYARTGAGPSFPGVFNDYAASLISLWYEKEDNKINDLSEALEELGLTWKVAAQAVDETQLELKIGRLPHSQRGGAHDLVSIADVGFGVSQALPVLVALLAAEPGQIVYIEQPEIHLHPLAQRKMAVLLCRTARRGGPILVIETHSALLVREIRTMVAKGEYSAENVGLNWFQRGSEGTAKVHAAKLGEDGSYGTWPVDFDEIELESDKAYLDAVDKRMAKAAKK